MTTTTTAETARPRLFRIRPGIVEAMQLTIDNADQVAAWCRGRTLPSSPGWIVCGPIQANPAGPGSWIVHHPDGSWTIEPETRFTTHTDPIGPDLP